MKKFAVAAVLLTTLAVAAVAQNVQDMGTWYRNPQSGQKVDANGNAYNNDASRDRDFWVWPGAAISDSVGTFTADSLLTPLYTAQCKRMWLRVQVTWPRSTDAATNVKAAFFAVQVRAHLTAQVDSLNTNPWYVYSDSARTKSLTSGATDAYAAAIDSTNQQSVWQSKPMINEFYFRAVRGQVRGLASTIAPLQQPRYYGEPENFWIPLADLRGVYYWAPYTTVRVRTISNNSNSPAQVVVDLVGTAN